MESSDFEQLKKAVEENPNNATAWYELGTLLDTEADVGAAMYYTQAISLEPYNPQFHTALISMWFDAGHIETAFESLEIATDLIRDPESASWAELGALYVDIVANRLHNLDLENARTLLEMIPPKEISKIPELKNSLKAYGELLLTDMEVVEGYAVDRPYKHAKALPALRLNQARFEAAVGA